MTEKQLEWIVCVEGRGRLQAAEHTESRISSFEPNSVAINKGTTPDGFVQAWLIGTDQHYLIPPEEIEPIDPSQTGDKHEYKICNVCHCLKPVAEFARNQTNKHGEIRRPSCLKCRADIDKRPPKSSQAKRMEGQRPQEGSAYQCPICRKRCIVGVTAKVVADHDHRSGDIRDFICESCNTGLGRFKDDITILRNAIMYLEEGDSLRDRTK